MLQAVAKLLKILNSETEPGQISLAVGFSLIAGLTPLFSLHNLLVLLLVFILPINLSSFFLGVVFFSGIAYLLDPLFHQLGRVILTEPALELFWTDLYNSTLWRLERFNNTIVMGSLAVSLVSFIPVHLLTRSAVRRYRQSFLEWVRKTRLMQALQASRFYRIYTSYHRLRGGE